MLTKQTLDFTHFDSAKPDMNENMIQILQDQQAKSQLKTTQEEKLFFQLQQSQSLPLQPQQQQYYQQHQEKPLYRDKRAALTKPSPGNINRMLNVPSSQQSSQAITAHSQLHAKQRPPAAYSHQQRQIRPNYQRSQSSNIKIFRKPDIDHSPFRHEGRRSFSSGVGRCTWDERLNALSQSLKDICGSPTKTPVSFSGSNTVPVDTQVSKDRQKSHKSTLTSSLTLPTPLHLQSSVKSKRSSDPFLHVKPAARETRGSFDGSVYGARSLGAAKYGVPGSALAKSFAPKNKKNEVSFAAGQPTVIKDTYTLRQLTEELNNLEIKLLAAAENNKNNGDRVLEPSASGSSMLASHSENPLQLREMQHSTESTTFFEGSPKFHHHSSRLPPMSPRYSCSLPGSNFSSPGNTLVKMSNAAAKPKPCMRRINSVSLELIHQPVFIMDQNLKKIIVRHEESSKSLELELARVLFSNMNQASSSNKNRIQNADSEMSGINTFTDPVRNGFLYKVAIKPQKASVEDLFVQLVDERTLRVGILQLTLSSHSPKALREYGRSSPLETEKVNPNGATPIISSTILDEIVLPNELLGWTCSLNEDRRWLTVREVFRSTAVDPSHPTSLSSSPSTLHSFLDYSPKSGRLVSDSKQTVPILEYSTNCSARYHPIIVSHNNSSQLSIVMRIPQEYDFEDLMVKRFDQKVIITGRKKLQLDNSNIVGCATQPNNALYQESVIAADWNPSQSSPASFNDDQTSTTATTAVTTTPPTPTTADSTTTTSESSVADEAAVVAISTATSALLLASAIAAAPELMESSGFLQSDDFSQNKTRPLPPSFTRSLSGQMSEAVTYFNVTIPLPPSALGRTLGAYLTPHKNVVLYAALNQTRRRLSF